MSSSKGLWAMNFVDIYVFATYPISSLCIERKLKSFKKLDA